MHQTKIPDIGGDFIFSAGLGFLNSLIAPIFKLSQAQIKVLRLSLVALVLNFAVYAIIRLFPLGIFVTSLEGYVIAAVAASIGSVLINYLAWKRTEPSQETHLSHVPHQHHDDPEF